MNINDDAVDPSIFPTANRASTSNSTPSLIEALERLGAGHAEPLSLLLAADEDLPTDYRVLACLTRCEPTTVRDAAGCSWHRLYSEHYPGSPLCFRADIDHGGPFGEFVPLSVFPRVVVDGEMKREYGKNSAAYGALLSELVPDFDRDSARGWMEELRSLRERRAWVIEALQGLCPKELAPIEFGMPADHPAFADCPSRVLYALFACWLTSDPQLSGVISGAQRSPSSLVQSAVRAFSLPELPPPYSALLSHAANMRPMLREARGRWDSRAAR